MKRILFATLLFASVAQALASDVAVSMSIGQPGFYGRLDVDNYPQPQVIYRQPMTVRRVEMDRQPVYYRVPPGHAKNWRKHCASYNACGERAMFVQDNWYQHEYVPRYQERREAHRDEHRSNNSGDNREHGRNH